MSTRAESHSVQTSSDISTKLHEVIDDLVATLAKASDAAHAHFELGLERTLQQVRGSCSIAPLIQS
jgi:hypothetical protein